MPNLGAYFPDEEAATVLAAAEAAGQKRNSYITDAVRERMRREGHVPGTPAHDIRAAAVAAAEAEATLAFDIARSLLLAPAFSEGHDALEAAGTPAPEVVAAAAAVAQRRRNATMRGDAHMPSMALLWLLRCSHLLSEAPPPCC